jgi:hypothetical protein
MPATQINSIQSLVNALVGLANSIIPLLLAVAVIVFIAGVIRYLAKGADNPQERQNIKSFLIWSVIAFAVMISIWSIALLLKNTLFPSAPCPAGTSGCTTAGTSNTSSNITSQANNQFLPG